MHSGEADVHHHISRRHIRIVGMTISTYSKYVVEQLAERAKLSLVHITSVHRTVQDQARIFFRKHVVEQKQANYKNEEVTHIVAHARRLHAKGFSEKMVQAYLMAAIEKAHGGPESISRHLLHSPFVEVFDVAHYSGPTHGPSRQNFMTDQQARAFLEACRAMIPFPIDRVGHSAELGIKIPHREFKDEKCFHLEILQPVFDRLEVTSPNRYA